MSAHTTGTSAHTADAPTVTGARPAPGRARTRLLAVLAAVAAALAVWVVAGPLTGVDLTVRTGGSDPYRVGPVAVALASALAGGAGWALLTLLERFTRRPCRVWTVVATAVILVSLTGPLGAHATSAATAALAGMHLVTGAVLVPLLARSSTPPARPAGPAGR